MAETREDLSTMSISTTTPLPQQPIEGQTPSSWSNINWATTYSSDEDSQSSGSTQFLFQDGDDAEEPLMVMVPLVMPTIDPTHTNTPPRTRRRTHSQAPLDVLVSLEYNSNNNSNNNSFEADEHGLTAGHDDAIDAFRRSRFVKRYSYFLTPVRVVFVLLALSSTILLGVPLNPRSRSPSAPQDEGVEVLMEQQQQQHAWEEARDGIDDESAFSVIQTATASIADSLAEPQQALRGALEVQSQPQKQQGLLRKTPQRLIRAVGSKDKPLTFRRKQEPSAMARFLQQEPYHFHVLYVSMLIAIILWSVREVQAHRRRGCVNQLQQS